MKIFEKSYHVLNSNIDELGHVNNIVYFEWIQDIANLHWKELKQGVDTSESIWVVIRHEIDYLNQALLGDVLKTKTWVGKTVGLKSVRHVEFYKDDKLIAKSKTTFCLLNQKTFKPIRITDQILSILTSK
tara:strand:+ start:45312 stop:45701 length:390 start_codon:yes stop_codon:yes gene_type:complete